MAQELVEKLIFSFVFSFYVSASVVGANTGTNPLVCAALARIGSDKEYSPTGKREEYFRVISHQIPPQEFAKRAYGEMGSEILTKLETIGPGFNKLVVDPGLMQYVDSFVEFANSHKEKDPWKARRLFRQKMGTTTVSRLMGFNSAKKDEVVRIGIHSAWGAKYDLEVLKKHAFKDLAWGHMSSGSRSFLVSVSNHPEIWYENTKFYINIYGKGMEDRKIYLFKVKVNKCDFIGPREGVKWFYPEGTIMDRKTTITHEDGRVEVIGNQVGEKESFVLFGIYPEEILSVSEYEFKGSVD